jgi:hypothetical protein
MRARAGEASFDEVGLVDDACGLAAGDADEDAALAADDE